MNPDNRLENQEPEESITAEKLMMAYWLLRLRGITESLQKGNTIYGADFDVSRCEAYMDKIAKGDLYTSTHIESTYDGEPKSVDEPSPYDFFKTMATDESQELQELMKNNPKFLEEQADKKQLANEILKELRGRIDNN